MVIPYHYYNYYPDWMQRTLNEESEEKKKKEEKEKKEKEEKEEKEKNKDKNIYLHFYDCLDQLSNDGKLYYQYSQTSNYGVPILFDTIENLRYGLSKFSKSNKSLFNSSINNWKFQLLDDFGSPILSVTKELEEENDNGEKKTITIPTDWLSLNLLEQGKHYCLVSPAPITLFASYHKNYLFDGASFCFYYSHTGGSGFAKSVIDRINYSYLRDKKNGGGPLIQNRTVCYLYDIDGKQKYILNDKYIPRLNPSHKFIVIIDDMHEN